MKNKLLTVLAVAVLALALWKVFAGPPMTRRPNEDLKRKAWWSKGRRRTNKIRI